MSAGSHSGRPVNGREPLFGVALVPRTPFVEAGAVDAAGDVDAEGEVAAAGADDFDAFAGADDFCAALTPLLVDGDVFDTLLLFVVELFVTELLVVLLLVTELFVTELFVVLLLLTLVFVEELVFELVLELVDDEVLGVEAWLHDVVLKLFTACQSFMCRLPGHGATLCGWLLPGP